MGHVIRDSISKSRLCIGQCRTLGISLTQATPSTLMLLSKCYEAKIIDKSTIDKPQIGRKAIIIK